MKPVNHHPAMRLTMRALWIAVVGAAWLGANLHLYATTGTNRPPSRSSADRFLLIVDTSSAMERNSENTQKAVTQLFSSGMVGQARPGDTIGLWTFSDELKTGELPLQRWAPQNRKKITAVVADFMAKLQYGKKSRFDKLVKPLTSVVKDSDRITVIILTEGTGKTTGTPFDKAINESYRLNYSDQRKQRMPFITILRAKGGAFIGWRVNTPPFRPEFPAFPPEPELAEPPVEISKSKPEPTPEPKIEPKTTTAPPLVVVGEIPPPTLPAATNASTVETTSTTAIEGPTSPNSPVQSKPDVQLTPVETTSSQPTATTDSPVTPESGEPPEPEPQPATEPAVTPPSTVASQAAKGPQPAAESPSAGPSPHELPEPTAVPPTQATVVQTAVATPGESLFNRTNLLIAGGVLLVGAFVVFYLLMSGSARSEEKVSLITRSMDRDQDNP